MRLLVLARNRTNYSIKRLREEAKKEGIRLAIADPADYEIVLGRKSPLLFRNGKKVGTVDSVLPRLGASITNHGLAVVTQFEMMGTRVVNNATAISQTRDKFRCIQLMSRYDIDIPRTIAVRKPSDLGGSIEMVGGFPVVLKLLSGTQGVGVMLAENMHSIESTLDTLWSLGQDILIQECIRESVGRDLRVIVVGGRVVACMRRQARIGEFRANIHRGGVGIGVKISPAYERIAKRAAKVSGLDVAGVDLLESHEGPKVIEVNSSPGFEGIEMATGVNVAREVLHFTMEAGSSGSIASAAQ